MLLQLFASLLSKSCPESIPSLQGAGELRERRLRGQMEADSRAEVVAVPWASQPQKLSRPNGLNTRGRTNGGCHPTGPTAAHQPRRAWSRGRQLEKRASSAGDTAMSKDLLSSRVILSSVRGCRGLLRPWSVVKWG